MADKTKAPPSQPVTPASKPLSGNGEKPVESKADRFKRLANRRVPAALARLKHVEALANRASYEYTDEQATRIINVLAEALQRIKLAYSGQRSAAPEWRL